MRYTLGDPNNSELLIQTLAMPLAHEKGLQFSDIVEFSQFISAEVYTEGLLDTEHQIDVCDGIPSRDILSGRRICQHEMLIVEDLLEDLFKPFLQIHPDPPSIGPPR